MLLFLQSADYSQQQKVDKAQLEAAITKWVFCSNDEARQLDDGTSDVAIVVAAVRNACSNQEGRVRQSFVKSIRSSSALLGMPLDEAAVQRVADKSLADTAVELNNRVARHILEDRKR